MFAGSYRQENFKDKDTHMKPLNKIDLLPGGHRSKVPHFKNTY